MYRGVFVNLYTVYIILLLNVDFLKSESKVTFALDFTFNMCKVKVTVMTVCVLFIFFHIFLNFLYWTNMFSLSSDFVQN